MGKIGDQSIVKVIVQKRKKGSEHKGPGNLLLMAYMADSFAGFQVKDLIGEVIE